MQLLSSGNNTVDMVYHDFARAFDKVDHGVLLHNIKMLGITGKSGVWLYHFLPYVEPNLLGCKEVLALTVL